MSCYTVPGHDIVAAFLSQLFFMQEHHPQRFSIARARMSCLDLVVGLAVQTFLAHELLRHTQCTD